MRPTFLILLFVGTFVLSGQVSRNHGAVQRVTVHGKSLEGNLEGDSPDRDVAVYLPSGYDASAPKRYPVIYLLHGFTDDVDNWWGVKPHFVNVPEILDRAQDSGTGNMIVVMPNAFTRYEGSMYSSSATTGDWEEFVSQELVTFIDTHYRTIATSAGRGLAGHSMGGYGAIRIAMKHPGVYGSLYLLSPCCMETQNVRANPKAEAIHDPAEVASADFFTKVVFASAAAWSPNPKNPPFFFDLPFKDGELRPAIVAKWQANAPLAMVDQYISALRTYKAIGMDAGDKDQPIAGTVTKLHDVLNVYGIPHGYEIYEGNHVDHIAQRLEKNVLAFFSKSFQ